MEAMQVPRAKPVGWYHIFHRDDLKRIAPLWLEFCGKVAAPEHLDRDKNITSPFSASRAYITIVLESRQKPL